MDKSPHGNIKLFDIEEAFTIFVAENLVCGDIGLGFAVSKGQLEVNVISARNMIKTENPVPTGESKNAQKGGCC